MNKLLYGIIVLCLVGNNSVMAHDSGMSVVEGVIVGLAVGTMIHDQQRPLHIHPRLPPYSPPPYTYPTYTNRPMYRGVDVYDPQCGCYRTVMMRIN